MIVTHYNENIAGLEIKDKSEFIKRLKTLGEFLKAIPYSEPGFQFKSYKSIINWAINNEPGNFDVLVKGFNNYVESSVLYSFFDNDSVDLKRAIEHINQKALIREEIEKKDVISTSIAGFMSIGLTGFLGGANEISEVVMPKITGLVAHCAMAPTLVSTAHVGVAILAFYKTFQIMNGVVHEVEEKAKKDRIGFTTPKLLGDLDVAKDHLRNQLFKDVLVIKDFNTQIPENQKYLDLLMFANQKLTDVSLKISDELIKKHGITEKEAKLLNSLDFDRVHQIANVSNIDVRKWMLLGKVDQDHEFYYKTVSDAIFLIGEKDLTKSVDLSMPYVTNMPADLRKNINELLPDSKKMINTYFSVVTKKDGICPNQEFKMIKSCILKYAESPELLASILTENLQTKMKHCDLKEIKNKELNYLTRITKFVLGNTDERLTKNNDSVRSYILKVSEKNGFTDTEKVVKKHPGFLEKMSNKTVNILYKIADIRDKLKQEVGILGNNMAKI